MTKKKNPVVHLKQSDVKNMKNEATNMGIRYALVLFLSVMRDKEGYGAKRLSRIFDNVDKLADSVNQGYVNLFDLETALREEANIHVSINTKHKGGDNQ